MTALIPDFAVPNAQKFVVPYMGNCAPEVRNAVLKALCNSEGMRLPNTFLPEGTALLPSGEEARRKLACQLEALDDVHPALMAYDARLKAENATDVRVPIQSMRMSHLTGGLHGKDHDATKAIGYTADGFSHVAAYLKPSAIRAGFSENLLALPNDLRSKVFNHWAISSMRAEDVVARIFNGGNGKIIRAVTSEKHSLETGDDRSILPPLLKMNPGAKCRITREAGGRISVIEIIWPMMDRELRVGDIAYGGIRITNSETKASSLRVEAFVLRIQCYNFTTSFSEDYNADDLNLRHVGDLSKRLPAVIERARQRIEPLVFAFGDAYKDTLPSAMATRGEALERVGKVFALPQSTLSLAASLWDADGLKSAGDTRAGLVHALTRASQEQGVSDAAVTERVAGRIILDGWGALAA